jgi:hypothetical protein
MSVATTTKGRMLAVAALSIALCGVAGAAEAPDWLSAIARAPITVSTAEADAVVLSTEMSMEVERDGDRVQRMRYVVKVLNADGRQHARAMTDYLGGAMQVSSFKAWLVQPGGRTIAFGKRDVSDAAVHMNALELYGEQRRQSINGSGDAVPGTVFGAEIVVRGRTIMNQLVWRFGGRLPVERSTFALKLAPGWSAVEHVFNRAPLSATVQGDRRAWTLTQLPAQVDEPMGPPPHTVAPWLALNLVPPAGSAAAQAGMPTSGWPEIARFFTPRYEAAAQADPALVSRAQALVQGAATPFERLQRLTQFVQRVNYIFIALDAANAGGFIPRPAARVLQCNYGDCKDKATLLRALLAAVGVKSYPLIVLASGRQRIEADWPAAIQFNHCILAISVDDSVDSSAIMAHPTLGRLLVFDPTDQHTPVGLLARERLADQALLLAAEGGGLIELPPARPEGDRLVRTVTARIDSFGNIAGRIEEHYHGVAASEPRRTFVAARDDAFQRRIERWLGGTLPALRNVKLTPQDLFPAPEFKLGIEFISGGYGKLMRDELLTFKPALVSRRDAMRLAKKARTLPIALKAQAYEERAVFTLPPDCVVDELLAPVAFEAEFGSYRALSRAEGRKVFFERSLVLRTVEVPASDYEKVRAFFDRVTRSEQSPIVLRRVREVPDPGEARLVSTPATAPAVTPERE